MVGYERSLFFLQIDHEFTYFYVNLVKQLSNGLIRNWIKFFCAAFYCHPCQHLCNNCFHFFIVFSPFFFIKFICIISFHYSWDLLSHALSYAFQFFFSGKFRCFFLYFFLCSGCFSDQIFDGAGHSLMVNGTLLIWSGDFELNLFPLQGDQIGDLVIFILVLVDGHLRLLIKLKI